MHKEYLTDEARKSAIINITECIDALNNEPGLSYKIGHINLSRTIDYLIRYRQVVSRELSEDKQ